MPGSYLSSSLNAEQNRSRNHAVLDQKVVDVSGFLSDCNSPIWAVLLSTVSGIGAWLLGRRNMANLNEMLQVGTDTAGIV
jgi:hypothetical protein